MDYRKSCQVISEITALITQITQKEAWVIIQVTGNLKLRYLIDEYVH